MEQRMIIEFNDHIDLTGLLKKYDHDFDEYVTMQLGYDGNIYILFNKSIPERIDGMFVPTESNSVFDVLVLRIDWDEEKVINEEYYHLGVQKMNYSFIQPIQGGFLLVSARCSYKKDGPENNAVIVDHEGNKITEFCLGDGISHCMVNPSSEMITGYFDEGIFGNYGWEEPLGACGVRAWGRDGRDIWKADKEIYDCYAMNISDKGDIWYYYYNDFRLVRVNINGSYDREYDPEIEGADSLIISEDEYTLVMDIGYDEHEEFVMRRIIGDRLSDEIPLIFTYEGEKSNVRLISSYGSRAVFVDDGNRMMIKRF